MNQDAVPSSRMIDSKAPAGVPAPTAVKPVVTGSAGAVAGAAIGAFAGPVGAVAGAVVGAIAGAAAGASLVTEDVVRGDAEKALDEEIGVQGGSIGAAPRSAPPATRGTFSAASSGVGGAAPDEGGAPAEGGIPKAE